MMTTLKDKFLIGWFAISSFCLAVLYLLADRRGRQISQLKDDAQRQILAQKLLAIREKSQRSEEHAAEASADYEALKRRHANLLQQWGIFTGGTKPGAPSNEGPSGTS